MTTGLNSLDNQNVIHSINANDMEDRTGIDLNRQIAENLLKESASCLMGSNEKREQAQQYLQAADALEKMAEAVRQKAQKVRNGELDKDQAVEEVSAVIQGVLEFPLSKDMPPNVLDEIADRLDDQARKNRIIADDLLQDAESLDSKSVKLKEQAEKVIQKDMSFFSDLGMKSIVSRNEGLKFVYEKLGIFRIDEQYRQQVAYAEQKSQEQAKSR